MKPLPDAVKKFIASAPVCRLATARASGHPHIIPVCPAFDADSSTLYIDLTRRGASARALRENDRLAVLIDEYDDDWSRLKAVILHCRAQPVEGEELDQAWELFRAKFPQGEGFWNPRLTLALRIDA